MDNGKRIFDRNKLPLVPHCLLFLIVHCPLSIVHCFVHCPLSIVH